MSPVPDVAFHQEYFWKKIFMKRWNIIKALAQRRESVGFQDGNDKKATILVHAVTLVFLLCWGPFQEVKFAYLAFLNECLNPLQSSQGSTRKKLAPIYRRLHIIKRESETDDSSRTDWKSVAEYLYILHLDFFKRNDDFSAYKHPYYLQPCGHTWRPKQHKWQ
ncbi:B1 bradykinin receptor-like protein [Lates japonicus]|uniref:B1 bradykinin receptor-like protein n=1 Tax=Lates japonicus TaxID=270547 RepID=A0AAD3NJG6_LATJO|nr:B1 bradykinin receptor-like protein [Lates japonicus]